MNPDDACPCGTGESYAQCCGPFHEGKAAAPTAERLMRSRYTAFALGLERYLLDTWAEQTRPLSLGLGSVGDSSGAEAADPAESVGAVEWKRLFIHDISAGGPSDERGIVEFTAIGRTPNGRFEQRERSRFGRDVRGRWAYIDGDTD